ncbi:MULTISPECIES: MFS transporter [unclassified Streptomyces]|uniref:MFS transporter n=1 Tax=unclassified Streptomyces TaxID=2593676 RepID=UPI002E810D82|nr:MFS transporter [Streptomyces sp. NBC_00589]WTI42177.1 MFS transporter [Streptomyces sp. NBC_00775]WUB24141.1 MFS transporter [Streptomyces sp. NBC_00589]
MYKNSRGRPGAVLAAAAVAQFVFALDMSVVNVALPAIRTALGFAPLNLSWIVHGYALTFGGLLLLGGRACDLYGHRRLFVLGLAVFGLCSLGGGLAQEPWQLIAARAGQGLGAAAAAPAALGMLTTTFPEGPRRVRALGVWSAVNAAGGALGVLAGGLLTEYAGWRWVMLVNLPIVAAALALVPAGVPAGAQPDRRERPDVLGAVLATGGVGLLVFGVVSTDVRGWGSPATVATLAAAAALLAAFAFVESKATAPLLRLGLLRSRWVAGANVLVFLAAAGQFAAFYFVSLYMQQVLGMGAAATGAAFLPFSVCLLAGIIIATRVTAARTPRAALVPGALLAAAGLAWFAFISPGGGFLTDVLGPCVITGVGVGLVLAPVAAAATTGVASREAGMASGLFNSSRQLGGCVGLAVLATVAALRTGPATDPAALNDGYALSLALTAGLFVVAAAVAIGVLPRSRAALPDPQPAAPAKNALEGTPS